MIEDDLIDLRRQEYGQRILVEKLRREVYGQPDPAASETLLDRLIEAERELARIEQHRAAVQATDESSGLIIKETTGMSHAGGVRGLETTGLEATVHLRMAQIPTSYYHLLDAARTPLITFTIENHTRRYRRIRVSSFIEGYSAKAVDTFEIPPNSSETRDQLPHLFGDRAASIAEVTRAMLNVLIEDIDANRVEIHQSYPIWLLARTSAPLYVQDPTTGKWQNITRYLGTFVTPNAPDIMQFVRRAVESHPERQFLGYQADQSVVEPEVEALFNAIKNESDMRYVNSVISFSPEQSTFTQRVRLPHESLRDRQANCIDGTVLFASLLEAISLSPAIVLVPGHAFLAWETWHDGKGNYSNEWRYLETTMIGSHTFAQACSSAEKTAARWQSEASFYNDPTRFHIWPVRQLRAEYGILPMG